jgi:hypothetical protein
MSGWKGGHPEEENGRTTPAALIASLLSVVVTLLGVVITEASGLNEAGFVLPLAYGSLGVALFILAGIYGNAFLFDLRAERRKLHFGTLVNRAIPKLVVFAKREDVLTIGENGNASLEWRFDLVAPRGEPISELTFPIYGEVDDLSTAQADFVEIECVEVNAEVQTGVLEPRELRESLTTGRPSLLYSVLRVPVDLGDGKESCSLRVRLRLKGIFPRAADWEAFYVDIPYLTEELQVTLRSQAGRVQRPLGDGAVVRAMSGLMEVPDDAESASQAVRCNPIGRALVWKTSTPKLGYRYQVRFQCQSS